MGDSGKPGKPDDVAALRISSGFQVKQHARECGIDMPAIVARYTNDPTEQGVVLPVSAERVAQRIERGEAILATIGTTFVGCTFAVEIGAPSGVRHFELSTMFVPLAHRMHRIAEDHLYPAVIRMVQERRGVLLGTTKFGFVVRLGGKFDMVPINGMTLPPEVRAELCTNVSCFDPGPAGICRKERIWKPNDPAWVDGTHCCIRRLGG